MSTKKDMLNRLSGVAKSAPLQESSSEYESTGQLDKTEAKGKKSKPVRKAKNLQIPADLSENPRLPLCCSTNHDGIGSRIGQYLTGF